MGQQQSTESGAPSLPSFFTGQETPEEFASKRAVLQQVAPYLLQNRGAIEAIAQLKQENNDVAEQANALYAWGQAFYLANPDAGTYEYDKKVKKLWRTSRVSRAWKGAVLPAMESYGLEPQGVAKAHEFMNRILDVYGMGTQNRDRSLGAYHLELNSLPSLFAP